jgi:hypothetical protein
MVDFGIPDKKNYRVGFVEKEEADYAEGESEAKLDVPRSRWYDGLLRRSGGAKWISIHIMWTRLDKQEQSINYVISNAKTLGRSL